MEPVPTTLYHVDDFEDPLSAGKRLYRSDDAVYESRSLGDAEARIYEERGAWRVKLRFPETDDAEAWDVYNDLVDRAPDRVDLSTDQRSFHTGLEADDSVGVKDAGTKLLYNRENRVAMPASRTDALGGKALTVGEYLAKLGGGGSGAGTLLGAGAGFLLGGPAGVVPGAVLGGGGLGLSGLIATPFVMQEHDWDGGLRGDSTLEKKQRAWAGRVNGWRARWHRRKDGPDRDLVEDLNRRNALQTILPRLEEYRPGANTELDALEDADLDESYELLRNIHFDSFHKLPGVTLSTREDTYEEALDTVARYAGMDAVEVEEPSLYTHPDAFATMLGHLTYTDGGEERITEGGEALIANAMDRGDRPDAIDRFIDDRYEEHLQRIAFDR